VFTHFYNARSLEQTLIMKDNEHKIMQMQTLETFIPHLIGKEEEKEVALIAITSAKTGGDKAHPYGWRR
jgi:hypothetical protein